MEEFLCGGTKASGQQAVWKYGGSTNIAKQYNSHSIFMLRSIKLLIAFVTLLSIYSCSTTNYGQNEDKSKPIFVLNNYGRLYEPTCINYFNLSNIDRIMAGGRYKNSKNGLITVYLKDSVHLISFAEFLQHHSLEKIYKRQFPVYLDTILISKPSKLVFDASQKLNCKLVCDSTKGNSSPSCFLRISRNK